MPLPIWPGADDADLSEYSTPCSCPIDAKPGSLSFGSVACHFYDEPPDDTIGADRYFTWSTPELVEFRRQFRQRLKRSATRP